MGNDLAENIFGKGEHDLKEHSRVCDQGLFSKQICA